MLLAGLERIALVDRNWSFYICRSLFISAVVQITDQRSDEILAVERRYNEIRRPVYLERNKLMRDVPDLWLQCLLQHQQIAELVSERDTDVLSFLEEVAATVN